MKEIEVLMRVMGGVEELEQKLHEVATFVGAVHVEDQYYFDPLRRDKYFSQEGRFIASFRLRSKDGKAKITHKQDHFDSAGMWTYSDELETEVGDYAVAAELIDTLGFEKLVRLDMVKKTFTTSQYEIVLEEVADLGTFLEVEALAVANADNPAEVKNRIRDFIASLGVEGEEEVLMGKVELLWKQHTLEI